MSFTHLDLFSGIGGFALAVRWLGGKTVAFCDTDPFSQGVLRKNFPGVPIHDDIHTLRGDAYGPVDLVTGGFPCQPYSIAGQRRGSTDDRALWPEMARVIAECRPRYVLGENTPGIDSLDLDRVLSILEGLGYTARAIGVPAIAVDAPHIRKRTWVMAHAGGCQQSGNIPDPSGLRYGVSEDEVRTGRDGSLYGYRWPDEPAVARMADGLPGGVDRRRALGNAIVPQVAYEILRVMLEDAA